MTSESDAARAELGELEQEIARVKALLRELGLPSSTPMVSAADETGGDAARGADPSLPSTDHTNALTIAWVSAEGFVDPAQSESDPSSSSSLSPPPPSHPPIKLAVQLSSPVEEATLHRLHYDGNDDNDDPPNVVEGGTCTFRGVETGQATLTVVGIRHAKNEEEDGEAVDTAKVEVVTGPSLHDLGPIIKFDAMDPDTKVVEATVVSRLAVVAGDDVEVSTDEPEEGATPEASDDEDKVVGTVTLRLTFRPSAQDRREELYEILNRATQRKAAAVERLRSAAVAEQRRLQQQQQQGASSSSGKSMVTRSGSAASPAVRSGFLNKPSKDDEKKPWRIRVLYEKYVGPNSLARQIFPVARNYLSFAVAVYLMHTKGQLLALPAPV